MRLLQKMCCYRAVITHDFKLLERCTCEDEDKTTACLMARKWDECKWAIDQHLSVTNEEGKTRGPIPSQQPA